MCPTTDVNIVHAYNGIIYIQGQIISCNWPKFKSVGVYHIKWIKI